jgi:glycerol uptake facilitator-like aquaporin
MAGIILLQTIGCVLAATLLLWLIYRFLRFVHQQYHTRATSAVGRTLQVALLLLFWGAELLVGGWLGYAGIRSLSSTFRPDSSEQIIGVSAIAVALLIYWHLAHSWLIWRQE